MKCTMFVTSKFLYTCHLCVCLAHVRRDRNTHNQRKKCLLIVFYGDALHLIVAYSGSNAYLEQTMTRPYVWSICDKTTQTALKIIFDLCQLQPLNWCCSKFEVSSLRSSRDVS